MPAVANQTNFISGLEVTANNPTGAVNATVTVAGLASGGTLVYGLNALATGAAVPNPVPLIIEFNTPIPASAVNVAITVTLSALGAGGIGQVNVHGFLV
jgi:hypothetical protein